MKLLFYKTKDTDKNSSNPMCYIVIRIQDANEPKLKNSISIEITHAAAKIRECEHQLLQVSPSLQFLKDDLENILRKLNHLMIQNQSCPWGNYVLNSIEFCEDFGKAVRLISAQNYFETFKDTTPVIIQFPGYKSEFLQNLYNGNYVKMQNPSMKFLPQFLLDEIQICIENSLKEEKNIESPTLNSETFNFEVSYIKGRLQDKDLYTPKAYSEKDNLAKTKQLYDKTSTELKADENKKEIEKLTEEIKNTCIRKS